LNRHGGFGIPSLVHLVQTMALQLPLHAFAASLRPLTRKTAANQLLLFTLNFVAAKEDLVFTAI
jgi:hypothetical protein